MSEALHSVTEAAVGAGVRVSAGAPVGAGVLGGMAAGDGAGVLGGMALGAGPMAATLAVAAALALLLWPGRSRLTGVSRARRVVRHGRVARQAARRTLPVVLGRRDSGSRGAAAWLLGSGLAVAGCQAALQMVPWQVVITCLLTGYTASRVFRRARIAARSRRECAALTAALRGIVRELRAGVPPRAAMDYAAADAAPEIRHVLQAIALANGSPPGAPRRPAAVPAEVVDQIQQAWTASLAHGIPLAAVLTACIADLDDRAAVAQLRAQHVAGPAVSGYVLAALPAAGIGMGAGLGSHPVDVLVGSSLGGALLVIGVGLCCAGLLWTGRIVRGGDD